MKKKTRIMSIVLLSLLVLLVVPSVQAGIIYEYRTKEIPQIVYIRYPSENIYWNVVDATKFEYWVKIKQDRFGEYSGDGKIKVIGTINGKRIEMTYDLVKIVQVNPHRYGQWFVFDTKINVNYDNRRTHYRATINIVTGGTECYSVISGNGWDEFNGIILFYGC